MAGMHAEYLSGLVKSLEGAGKGESCGFIEDAARFLNCSKDTVYRRLKAIGWQSGRKTRSDCGRRTVDEDTALTVAGMVKVATRANGKRTMSTRLAVEILSANGVCTAQGERLPATSTMLRAMRDYGVHPDQIRKGGTPVQLRSLHPNHVWEMDASICVVYYLRNGNMGVMDEAVFNSNKPYNLAKIEDKRVIRWVITDHTSGSIFCHYTQGNEDSASAINVLILAMCKRKNAHDMFYGAPFELYTDKGAPFVSGMWKAFVKRCGIRHYTHKAKNARATGQVESAQNIIERQFESRLRLLEINGIEELNACLDKWRISFNATAIHSRTRKPRREVWASIKQEQLRVPESAAALRSIVANPAESRSVPDTMLLYFTPKGMEKHAYNLADVPGLLPGHKIGVSVNPYEAPAIDVIVTALDGSEAIYVVRPIKTDAYGFAVDAPVMGREFKANAETATDKAVKRMEKAAYGVNTLEEAEAARRKNQRAYAEIDAMKDVEKARIQPYMPKRGTALGVSGPQRELKPLNIVEATAKIMPLYKDAGLEWSGQCMERLAELYPAGVPALEVEEAAQKLINAAMPQHEDGYYRGVA